MNTGNPPPPPPPRFFTGNQADPAVKDFLRVMREHHKEPVGAQLVAALVKSAYPVWMCQSLLTELTKVINKDPLTPLHPPRGKPKLTIIQGGKS